LNTHALPDRARTRRSLLLGGVLALLALLGTQLATGPLAGQVDGESVVVSVNVIGAEDTTAIDVIAIPEKRIPPFGNDSTILTIEVREPGQTTPLSTTEITTNAYGGYSGALLAGIAPGTYDLTAKGYSHLRLKKSLVDIFEGARVDFSEDRTIHLLSGDVNFEHGDNYVNGIDLSLLVSDLLGTTERYDLNRDGLVNGIDLSNAVANLLVLGDA